MDNDQHRKTQLTIGYIAIGLLVLFGLQWFSVQGSPRSRTAISSSTSPMGGCARW